jgi:hypothetical protein
MASLEEDVLAARKRKADDEFTATPPGPGFSRPNGGFQLILDDNGGYNMDAVANRTRERLAASSGVSPEATPNYGDLGLATQAPSSMEVAIARAMGRNGGR